MTRRTRSIGVGSRTDWHNVGSVVRYDAETLSISISWTELTPLDEGKQSQQKAARGLRTQRTSNDGPPRAHVGCDSGHLVTPCPPSAPEVLATPATFGPSLTDNSTERNMASSTAWEDLIVDETILNLSDFADFSPLSPPLSDPQGMHLDSASRSLAGDDHAESIVFGGQTPQMACLAKDDVVQPWLGQNVQVRDAQPLSHTAITSTNLKNTNPTRQPTSQTFNDSREFTVAPKLSRGWLGPLHLAAGSGHDRIMRALLKRQSSDCDINGPDSDGMTALMHAVQGGFNDVSQSLLDAGAVLDRADSQGRTALHWAVLKRRETMLRQFLECGATRSVDLDTYNKQGRTPLHIAIEEGFEAGVQILLDFGVDLGRKAQK